VPWDKAWELDEVERQGYAIMFSEFKGAEFDVHTMSFKDSPK